MRKIDDVETVKLDFQVHGDFTSNEADELKRFIFDNIIGRDNDYFTLMDKYCEVHGYRLTMIENVLNIYK